MLIISIIILIGIFLQVYLTYDNGIHKLPPIQVNEVRVLDPLCIDPFDSKYYPSDFCDIVEGNSVLNLGLSPLYAHNPNLPTKVLLMKIDLSQIPQSNILQSITITAANLRLVSSHLLNTSYNESQVDFSIYYGLCQNSTWTILTPDKELPCQNELQHPQPFLFSTFTNSISNDISENSIDLTQQVIYARNSSHNSFTELVRFNPVRFLEPGGADPKLLNCLISLSPSDPTSAFNKCVDPYQIAVYGPEYGDVGDHPTLSVEYTQESPFTIQLGILLFVTVGSLIVNRYTTK